MSDKPVLLWDVMDTLVHDPFNYETPAFFGITRAELLEQNNSDAWIQFEEGLLDEQEYLRDYFTDRRTFDHQAFRRRLADAYRWIDGAEALLARLQQRGFEMHAFSNYSIWYEMIESRLGLSRYLKWTFVSCRTGVRKPAQAAFAGVARTLGRSLDSTLFIDNSVDNVSAAAELGMPAIQFSDTPRLWNELAARGIVP